MSYLQPHTKPSLPESRPWKLLGLSSLFLLTRPVWFSVRVDVIALGWKGLASNDAKKQKQKFPSYSTCTSSEMTCIILTRVYYCRGLPAASEGYFVLPAAPSLGTGYCTRLSCVTVV